MEKVLNKIGIIISTIIIIAFILLICAQLFNSIQTLSKLSNSCNKFDNYNIVVDKFSGEEMQIIKTKYDFVNVRTKNHKILIIPCEQLK